MSTQTKTTQNTNQSNNVFAIYKHNVQKPELFASKVLKFLNN